MALADTEDYAGDLAEVIADTPSTLVWGDQTISGTRSGITEESDVTDEYDYTPHDLEWLGRVSDFTDSTLPALQKTVTVDGTKYHIARIYRHQDGVGVLFSLRRI